MYNWIPRYFEQPKNWMLLFWHTHTQNIGGWIPYPQPNKIWCPFSEGKSLIYICTHGALLDNISVQWMVGTFRCIMHKAAIGGKLPTLSMTWLRMMTTSLLSIGYQYSSHNASFVQNVTVQVYITGVYDPLYSSVHPMRKWCNLV